MAVPFPDLDLLTYRVPQGFDAPPPGARVLVPLGARLVTGCVVGPAAPEDPSHKRTLKDIVDILDVDPFLPQDVLALTLWVAEYYACGPGQVVAAAVPPMAWLAGERVVEITERGRSALAGDTGGKPRWSVLEHLSSARRPVPVRDLARRHRAGKPSARPSRGRDGRRHADRLVRAAVRALAKEGLVQVNETLRGRAQAFKRVRTVTPTPAGLAWLEGAAVDRASLARSPLGVKQRDVLARLGSAPNGLDTAVLAADSISHDTVARLAARGLVAVGSRRVTRDPAEVVWSADERETCAPVTPTPAQAAALDRLTSLARERAFRTVLLHGVTGSGKTEVYLRLAKTVLDAGLSTLVLVPEIALTPAAVLAFRRALGNRVAILHSGLSDGERHDQWHRIRRGEIGAVIGTRSAVFAPIPSLGLIVVDEEHDTSYKQDEDPRYHARDVAVMRGKQAGALVILGSATPSLESFQNAARGRYERIALPRRVLDRPLASIHLVDMREEYAAGGPHVVLSGALKEALRERMARGEQALVLLNRRGYSPTLFCRQCVSVLECPNCSVSLTIHQESHRACCHYCNYATPIPDVCLQCGSGFLELAGFGTERVQDEVAALLPDARVARLDRDTARARGAGASRLSRFARGETDVLVGTQMIAKGHDFARVTLVGVVSADVGLGLADFRAAERTFQLLTQVAGRAGRGDQPGTALIQTLYPNHYSVRYACAQDYGAFFESELRYRATMQYPPIAALVNAVVRAPTLARAMTDATRLAQRLRGGRGYRVVGPAPAPLVRLRGEYRAQFFLKGTNRSVMRNRVMAAVDAEPGLRRRVTVDIDPLSVL